MGGGSVNNRMLTLVTPIHLLSVTLNLIRMFTKRQIPRGGVYGGLIILAHPRLMVHEGTPYITTLPEVSEPSSS